MNPTPASRAFFFCLIVLAPVIGAAQTFNLHNGVESSCSGTLYDSGGSGANYGNNQNITFTLCPDQSGAAIVLDFTQFALGAGDVLQVYDGNSTAAADLGAYIGSDLQGQTVQGSPLNTSGCLTIVFQSDGSGTGNFAASISCYLPCVRPTAAAVMGEASPALICPGETVQFDGSASFAAPGFSLSSWTWDFGDGATGSGQTTSHAYSDPGAYAVQLHLIDNNGCASTNPVDLMVMVGTAPTFNGTDGTLTGCPGGTLCLDGLVQGTPWNTLPQANLGGGVTLPDGSGVCYNTTLNFTQFVPGQTVSGPSDIVSLCASLEHSYMGDLVISLICPNGQSIVLHNQGGGGTYLGAANDNDAGGSPVLGACWNYCWSPTATLGTFANCAAFGPTPNVMNAGTPSNSALIPGTYSSVQSWNNLVGCPLNGDWTFRICDNLLLDNGFICDWSLEFNPALFPEAVSFTPVYGADADSSYWSGPHITSLSANADQVCVSPPSPGTYDYVYTVTDNFGCTYDTTLTVTIIPGPVVEAGADQVTCGTPVQLGATMVSGGLPGNCTYQIELVDSWGDGWNGNGNITVTVNGSSTTYYLPNGSFASYAIPVTHGDQIVLTYQGGTWNTENTFRLRNSAGTVVYTSPYNPPSGVAWTGTATCPVEPFTFTWSPTTGLSNPNVADPTATVSSTTTFCVTAVQPSHPECPATDCMTVTVDSGIDPGIGTSLTLCQNGSAIGLFGLLGGTPDVGGTWTAPGGAPHSGVLQPGSDPSGPYTYTVSGTGACGAATASAVIDVTINPLPNAGSDTTIVLCSAGPPLDLFDVLPGSPMPGGIWAAPNGFPHDGIFIPGETGEGNYEYVVQGAAPCPLASAIVWVQVVPQPTAAANGALTACPSGAPVDLVGHLNGTPSGSGTWTDPTGAAHSGIFDPANDPAGAYTFTVVATPPCVDATAQVFVSLAAEAQPGQDAALTLCVSGGPADLFNSLGGTPAPGGTWAAPDGMPHLGVFQPGVDVAGQYVYSVEGEAPCPSLSASVAVTVANEPNAGLDAATTLCTTGNTVDLFGLLGGMPEAGGSWTTPSGTVFNGQLDPAVHPSGDYTYQIIAPPPCTSDAAIVSVTIVAPADPGSAGSVTLCETDAPVGLIGQLGGAPQAGGTWTNPSGQAFAGVFDPSVHAAGNYTYTVQSPAPCAATSATVTVSVSSLANAGSDATLNLCTSSAPQDLFGQLGAADTGGSWTGPSGASFGGVFDPALHAAGTYTYSVNAAQPCPADQATVTVAVLSVADAGTNGSVALCSSSPSEALFAHLGGTPDTGGQWYTPTGAPFNGTFVPGTHAPGSYYYVQSAPAPCVNDTGFVAVTVAQHPDAGTDGSLLLCATAGNAEMMEALGGNPQPGGTWTGPTGATDGNFVPGQDLPGLYTYHVAGIAPCPSASATVTVGVETPPNAGSNGSIALCPEASPVDLFAHLGGTPSLNGTWTGPGGIPSSGTYDPATDPYGAYVYSVEGGSACPAATATVNVTLHPTPQPNAGPDAVSCSLTHTLGATGTWASGSWSGPADVTIASPTQPNSTVSSTTPGTYTLTWSVISDQGCQGSDEVSIVLTQPMSISGSATDATCHGQCNGTANATATGGNPGQTGYIYTWTGAGGQTGASVFGLCAGNYMVQATDMNGCSVQMTLTVDQPPPVEAEVVSAIGATCHGDCDGSVVVVGPVGAEFALAGSPTFNPDGSFTGLCGGNHMIIVRAPDGCQGTVVAHVADPPPVAVSFGAGPDTVFVSSPVVHFINGSSPSTVSYLWDFAGLGSSTEEHPSFTFPNDLGAEHMVCLTAWDANGCEGRYCAPVWVLDEMGVYVPNAFTPDGDEFNEAFMPIFNVSWIVDYEFQIFDRWGERIFVSNTPGEGWRGDRNGTAVPSGVYVWRLQCRDKFRNTAITRMGHVTLLR
jgi:gliding motility-associated-like protein